jgi:hypothetical protein
MSEVKSNRAWRLECEALRAELAEYQRCVEQVQGQADRAYCNYIERLRREECLGWENKLKRGLFGDAELKAHCAAAEQLGRHRALSEVAAATRLLSQAADALERAPRWRDVADELPTEAQEVLFVRGGKTVHGAWIGGIFWHNNQKMAAAYWMPLPLPPEESK